MRIVIAIGALQDLERIAAGTAGTTICPVPGDYDDIFGLAMS